MVLEFLDKKLTERQEQIVYANALAAFMLLFFNPLIVSFWPLQEANFFSIYILDMAVSIFSVGLLLSGNLCAVYVPLKIVNNKPLYTILLLIVFWIVSGIFFTVLRIGTEPNSNIIFDFAGSYNVIFPVCTFLLFSCLLFWEKRSLFVKNLMTLSGKYIYWFIVFIYILANTFFVMLMCEFLLIVIDAFVYSFRSASESQNNVFYVVIDAFIYSFIGIYYLIYLVSGYKALRLTMKGTEAPRTFMPIKRMWLVELYILLPIFIILFSPFILFPLGLALR